MSRLAGCPSVFFWRIPGKKFYLSAKGYTVPCIFPPKSDDQPGRGSEDGMKKLLMGSFCCCSGRRAWVGAQEESSPAEGTKTAASFRLTSTPKVSLLGASAQTAGVSKMGVDGADRRQGRLPLARPAVDPPGRRLGLDNILQPNPEQLSRRCRRRAAFLRLVERNGKQNCEPVNRAREGVRCRRTRHNLLREKRSPNPCRSLSCCR